MEISKIAEGVIFWTLIGIILAVWLQELLVQTGVFLGLLLIFSIGVVAFLAGVKSK